jgi:hypothetical protein
MNEMSGLDTTAEDHRRLLDHRGMNEISGLDTTAEDHCRLLDHQCMDVRGDK